MPRQKPHESYLDKKQAASRTGLSVRRLLELAAQGRIRKRHVLDPNLKRRIATFAEEDLDKIKAGDYLRGRMDANDYAAVNQPYHPSFEGLIRLLEEKLGGPAYVALPAWMNIEEASGHIGLPPAFLLGMIKSGRLPALDVGPRAGGRWRVHRTDLDAIRGEVQMQIGGSSTVAQQATP